MIYLKVYGHIAEEKETCAYASLVHICYLYVAICEMHMCTHMELRLECMACVRMVPGSNPVLADW